MYIRTKTSNLDIGGDIYIIDDDNFKIVDNGCGLEVWRKETNTRRPIKSQGDNLIDVLRDADILIPKDEELKHLVITYYRFKVSGGYDLSEYDVVTYEQYMKLAQEVK